METVRYVINDANQIACIDDTSADGHCDDGETVWQYDAFGNLLSDGTNTYIYDAANRLSSISNASGTTTYAYRCICVSRGNFRECLESRARE